MVEHGALTGGENAECCLNLSQWRREHVAVLLVLWWCDNRRYGGGSGCRPSHAGVTWAQIELSVEAKFYDALASSGPVLPICGCCRTVWWLGKGVHTRRGCRGIEWEIMFHRNTETSDRQADKIMGRKRDGVSHEPFDNQILYLKQSQGSLWCHLDGLNESTCRKYSCDSSV